ncbi:MAG: BtpA/SgcQ family protein [Planctomycetes bacterium]|nr:BtpA/SgcQ family protein [Planctomycetota bacterium]
MRVALPFSPGTKPLVGVVHLPPLPGSPGWVLDGRPPLDAIVERALADADAFLAVGFDGLVVENYGDAPFFKQVPPETVAALARCAREVVLRAAPRPVGVNALRNDARAALACAVASGARFVRVNVHTGVAATDQGLIEGEAAATLRLRDHLGASPGTPGAIAVLADVHVKHARPLVAEDLGRAASDAAERGRADALIVSGSATGHAPDPAALRAARDGAPGVPVWLGSGLSPEACPALVPWLDGAIAASAAREGGRAGRPVDPARAAALVEAFRRGG